MQLPTQIDGVIDERIVYDRVHGRLQAVRFEHRDWHRTFTMSYEGDQLASISDDDGGLHHWMYRLTRNARGWVTAIELTDGNAREATIGLAYDRDGLLTERDWRWTSGARSRDLFVAQGDALVVVEHNTDAYGSTWHDRYLLGRPTAGYRAWPDTAVTTDAAGRIATIRHGMSTVRYEY